MKFYKVYSLMERENQIPRNELVGIFTKFDLGEVYDEILANKNCIGIDIQKGNLTSSEMKKFTNGKVKYCNCIDEVNLAIQEKSQEMAD